MAFPDNFDSSKYEFLSRVSYKGVSYQKNFYVVLNSVEDSSDLIIGRIKFILIDCENHISFLLEEKRATNTYQGYYTIENLSEKIYRYHVHEDLVDYYPLPSYKFSAHECIILKHSNLFM